MNLLIKNVRIVDSQKDFIGDVYVKQGVIDEIGQGIEKDSNIIDGKGLVLMPSFVDMHSHFRDPGLTHKEDIKSGSLAAVCGGYTAVNLMANTKPVCSDMDMVNYVLKKAEDIALVDVHQCVSVTKGMKGEDVNHLKYIEKPVKFISEDGKGILKDEVMLMAMSIARDKGFTVISHAEHEEYVKWDSRLSENYMTMRDIETAKKTGCSLHIAHVSTREAMMMVKNAKKEGFNITCEVTPHHIALSSNTMYKVNPPLRLMDDINFLIDSIKEGYVDAIATDHAPHSFEDKLNGAPGISGIETAFSVCYTTLVRNGHITLNTLSKLMSEKPSKMMGLNKGKIEKGYDGDLVLVDIDKKFKVDAVKFKSKGKNTPFDGMEFYGVIAMTIKGGKVVFRSDYYDNR
ncbi:dihydroorotase [Caloramator quimbayensis]|uniref:Dihydroorotase n=1 Tax=Caloramator quimbayensis TaxID=1147123 RepID=A0A1T4X5T3_9CLOT|nr:dihydroorotase [Caloramator quimbayensis]SKA85030.1 dihydroorotase [Caloramator quimbayensis]